MMGLEPKRICAEEGTLTPEVSSAGVEPKTHCTQNGNRTHTFFRVFLFKNRVFRTFKSFFRIISKTALKI